MVRILWTLEFVSVELLLVKKNPLKKGKFWKFFEIDNYM